MKTACEWTSEMPLCYTEDGMGLDPFRQGEAVIRLIEKVIAAERRECFKLFEDELAFENALRKVEIGVRMERLRKARP